jgi:hypothetical protein
MLTAQLKKQAAQIDKASTQFEMRKPAANIIVKRPGAVPSGRVRTARTMKGK